MSEMLQEFVDSARHRLRVDRAAGVIRGVKLLGLASRNGRRYLEGALTEAAGLYEGAKVNINHPKGHPLAPRDYQDRLGVIRGVQFRAGDGLFGDLHFNPKHALSEQLVWDAEHAPQNVGMSHNVLARTSRSGDETIVDAITKVQSIDLVADPATTSGLYEHARTASSTEQAADNADAAPTTWDALTLDELRRHRPDLLTELQRSHESQLEQVRQELNTVAAREQVLRRREQIVALLEEHGLPLPAAGEAENGIVSGQFMEALMSAGDESVLRQLVEERAALVRSACHWNGKGCGEDRRPQSRDQAALAVESNGHRPRNAREFATAVRGR